MTVLREANGAAMNVSSSPRQVILCIDDDSEQLKLRTMILSSVGYTVLTATNAAAGLHLFMHNRVDLVISDHVLPDAAGADLLGEMKRANPKLPVVLLSGFSETPAGIEPADMFLTKGIAVPDFLAAIAKLLSRRAKSASSVNS